MTQLKTIKTTFFIFLKKPVVLLPGLIVGLILVVLSIVTADTPPTEGVIVNTDTGSTAGAGNADLLDGKDVTEIEVPSGLIALFDTNCPANWTRVTALDGKFLTGGSSYNAAAGGNDSITLIEANLPSHTHSVDPPSKASGNQSASHAHTISHTHAVGTLAAANESAHTHGPGTLATSDPGTHVHSLPGKNGVGANAYVRSGYESDPDIAINSGGAGAHTHTFSGSTAAGSAHTHTISGSTDGSSSGSSGNQSASHTHTTDIDSFSSGATGSGTAFDNRPAYATIVICKKD